MTSSGDRGVSGFGSKWVTDGGDGEGHQPVYEAQSGCREVFSPSDLVSPSGSVS